MAEVKPIPSAVGAFEAQVFNLTRTANVIQQQELYRKKLQADAKKEADKALSEMGTLLAKGRRQDLPYLKSLYDETTNFYSKNAPKIQPGTSEYNQFNELKAKFNYESQRSINEKETDKDFATFMSVNADKQKISDGSLEAWRVKQLAINDPNRASFQFKKRDGSSVPIDQVGLPDLEKYDRFDENDLRKDIEAIKPESVLTENFVRNYKGIAVPYGSIKETTLEFKTPSKLLQAFDSRYTGSTDAVSFYNNSWNNLSQKEKDDMNAAFATLNPTYQAAGIKEQVKIDEKDGVPGISNGYEFGAAKFLLQNLPMQVKENLNLQLANFYQGQYQFSRRMAQLQKTLKVQENLDTGLQKSLLDAGFKIKGFGNALNNVVGLSGEMTGTKYRPARIIAVDDDKKIAYAEFKYPVLTGGNLTKSFKDAVATSGLGTWKKGAKAWITKDIKGNWIKVVRKEYNLNPSTSGWDTQVINMNNDFEEAIRIGGDETSLKQFRGMRGVGAKMTDFSGQISDIILNP